MKVRKAVLHPDPLPQYSSKGLPSRLGLGFSHLFWESLKIRNRVAYPMLGALLFDESLLDPLVLKRE